MTDFLALGLMGASTLGYEAAKDWSLIDDVLNHGREPGWRTMRKVDAVMTRVRAARVAATADPPPDEPPAAVDRSAA